VAAHTISGVQDRAEEHRGRPRARELWVGGAWIAGICNMLAAGVLFVAGDADSGPARPGLAWPLVSVALVSFTVARLLQGRYERRVNEKPANFRTWLQRTGPQSRTRGYWLWRLVAFVVLAAFMVLSVSGHLGWAIVVAVVAAASIWVSERVPSIRMLTRRTTK
jgi:hypothetical protein